jgi:hypothetical protein
MSFEHVNSVLVADIGSVNTRLLLIDLVEGQYRLVASAHAPSTVEPPLNSASLGIDRAAQLITTTTGRLLLSGEKSQMFVIPENETGGVDEFLATSSAGRPMRVFLVGLTPEVSLASGQRVLASSYITVTGAITPEDRRSPEEKLNAILGGEPDLILIVGGTDNGADTILLGMLDMLKNALALITRGTIPAVLFAGNQALRAHVKAALSDITDIFFAPNVRPDLETEEIFATQIELALVYDDYRAKRAQGGFSEIANQSQIGVVPTTQGYISVMRYLSSLTDPGPFCIDVGSSNSLITGSVKRKANFHIRTDIGVGHHLPEAIQAVTPSAVLRWLPFDYSVDDLWDYAYNKQLRPGTIPYTAEELAIEQAVAREIIRLMMKDARKSWGLGEGEILPPFEPLIAAGAVLTETQHPGISALLLLDALQPIGETELLLDPYNLLSSLGIIAYLRPPITVQAMEAGSLLALGTAFSPEGKIRYGQDAMFVQIRASDGKVLNKTVRGGEIWMAPVLPGVHANVTIKLRRGLSLKGKRKIKASVIAGAAGIIFDARGRPLVMPRLRDRAERFMKWQLAMTGRDAESANTKDLMNPPDLYPDLDMPEEVLDALPS